MESAGTLVLPAHTRFEERQRFRQPWLWAVMLGVASAATASVALAVSTGQASHWVVLFLAGPAVLVYLLYRLELEVRVDDETLSIRFAPLSRKRIPLATIASCEPRTYRPLVEYGGWGIRYSLSGKGWAYNVSGNRGVQLVLTDGSRILVGSRRPSDLADALNRPGVLDPLNPI
jgi:hypothetical protein